MYPDKSFNEKVRQRVLELSGHDLGDKFRIGHIEEGPNATYDNLIEEMAKALISIENGDYDEVDPIKSDIEPIDVREFVKDLDDN